MSSSSTTTTSLLCVASTIALAALAPMETVEGFSTPNQSIRGIQSTIGNQRIAPPTVLRMAADAKDEVTMLREMAAKAREEAAALAKVRTDNTPG